MTGLLGAGRLVDAAEPALRVGADGLHVIVTRTAGGLTRFAASQIHQNVWREEITVRVTAVVDGTRLGVATGSALDAGAVRSTADDAATIARVTPQNAEFGGLASPATYAPVDRLDPATVEASPADRARMVSRALAELAPDMEAAGFVETQAEEVLVANTSGVRAYWAGTRAGMTMLAMGPTSSGWAEATAGRLEGIDAGPLAERAVRKAELSRSATIIEPGRYTVILEAPAVGTMIEYLSYVGFGARAFLEERSFIAGRIGQQVAAGLVTIIDDAIAPDAIGMPFDYEGTPSQRVALIEGGVARDVVWDRSTAAKVGRSSTGHGLPPPSPQGPFPMNLRLEPGTLTQDEMIASVERGILVTRFHYVNVVNEKETVLTGMTRDGTFLIEHGTLSHAIRNLRFTQSAIEALAQVEAIGDTTELVSDDEFGASRVPALKVAAFHFSSGTTH